MVMSDGILYYSSTQGGCQRNQCSNSLIVKERNPAVVIYCEAWSQKRLDPCKDEEAPEKVSFLISGHHIPYIQMILTNCKSVTFF